MLSQEQVQTLGGELKIDKERIAREFYEILILDEMRIRDQWDKRETLIVEFGIEEEILPQRFGLKLELSKRPAMNMEYELKLLHTPVSPLFATPRKTKKLHAANINVEYRHLKKELFTGYTLNKDRVMIATPEKALFDLYYLSSLGKMDFDFQTVDSNRVNMEKVNARSKCIESTGRCKSERGEYNDFELASEELETLRNES